MKLEFSRQIFEKSSNIKFHENPSSGSRILRTFVYSPFNHLTRLLVWKYFIFFPLNRVVYEILWEKYKTHCCVSTATMVTRTRQTVTYIAYLVSSLLRWRMFPLAVSRPWADCELTMRSLWSDRELTVSLTKVWIKHNLCQCYGMHIQTYFKYISLTTLLNRNSYSISGQEFGTFRCVSCASNFRLSNCIVLW